MGVNSERKTVLVVDDDPDVRDYASMVLEDCGYDVLQAPDGESALALLRDNDQIDLLFTDIKMPRLDGIEVARRACRKISRLKVLFATGFPEEYKIDLQPSDRLLKKPYRPRQLAEAIADALATSAGE
jgi:CheY-like chemotaxis protein